MYSHGVCYLTSSETSAKKRSAELISAYTLASPLKHVSSPLQRGEQLLLAAYDTKSQKQARLDPEWSCDWWVFYKPKKSIHWVSQETSSSSSFGVPSSPLAFRALLFQCSNYRMEKESTEIQYWKTNFVGHSSEESQMFFLIFIYLKTGFKHSPLAVNSPSLIAEPQLLQLVSQAVLRPNAKPSLHKLGIVKAHSECLAANKQMKQHITE